MRDGDEVPEGNRLFARFGHLKEETQEWLLTLDEEDLDRQRRMLRTFARAEVIGWALKWLVLSTTSLFIGVVTFGEALLKGWGWTLSFLGRG